MLLLADRGFFSFALWRKASDTGADLLWRIRTDPAGPQPQHLQDLPDGRGWPSCAAPPTANGGDRCWPG